jgi:hypothetical protein
MALKVEYSRPYNVPGIAEHSSTASSEVVLEVEHNQRTCLGAV